MENVAWIFQPDLSWAGLVGTQSLFLGWQSQTEYQARGRISGLAEQRKLGVGPLCEDPVRLFPLAASDGSW